MSASSFTLWGQASPAPFALFADVCREQRARLHTIRLLIDYLGAAPGGRRRFVAEEMQALVESYDDAWSDLAAIFPFDLVDATRLTLEASASLYTMTPLHSTDPGGILYDRAA